MGLKFKSGEHESLKINFLKICLTILVLSVQSFLEDTIYKVFIPEPYIRKKQRWIQWVIVMYL